MSTKPFKVAFICDRWEAGVTELTWQAEFVYFRLCKHMWATGKPVARRKLPQICRGCDIALECLEELLEAEKLFEDDGLLYNARAIDEHNTAVDLSEKAAAAAHARWDKHRTNEAKESAGNTTQQSNASCDAYASQTQTLNQPNTPPLTSFAHPPEGVPPNDGAAGQVEPEPEEPKPKRKRSTRVPEPWQWPGECVAILRDERGFDERAIRLEADIFSDYWRGQPGQKGVKLDWHATARNWCRRANPRDSPKAAGHSAPRGGPSADGFLAGLDRIVPG